MIISELEYIESVQETEKLEGGADYGSQYSSYTADISAFKMANGTGAGGNYNYLEAVKSSVSSSSGQYVGLGEYYYFPWVI